MTVALLYTHATYPANYPIKYARGYIAHTYGIYACMYMHMYIDMTYRAATSAPDKVTGFLTTRRNLVRASMASAKTVYICMCVYVHVHSRRLSNDVYVVKRVCMCT